MADAFVWWLTLEVLGTAAWPFAWIAMRRLPDRGWAFSKALGLLLVGYGAWLLGMCQLVPFSRASNLAVLLVLGGGAAWLVRRNDAALGREMAVFLRSQMRYWIAAEVLFSLAFGAWTFLRAYSPSIYGTEKFMDFAFLNSFTQGLTLPPVDPWLAGHSINYYYFGYTLMGTLCHLTGVDSAVGFNLANVTLFSLTVLGTFGLVCNLVTGLVRARRVVSTRPIAIVAPVPGRAMVPAGIVPLPTRRVGSRAGVAVAERDAAPTERTFQSKTGATIHFTSARAYGDGADWAVARPVEGAVLWSALATGLLGSLLVAVVGNMAGAQQVFQQGQTADTFNWWNPSRVIHDVGAPLGGETINEFPFFSFFLNDMHPHLLALPLVLLALGMALALLKAGALRPQDAAGALAQRRGLLAGGLEGRLRLVLYALVTGALFVTNTWDYPTYLGITLLCLALPILGTPAERWAGRQWSVVSGQSAPASTADLDNGNLGPLELRTRNPEPGTRGRDTRLGSWLMQAAALVALGLLLFLPFQVTFTSLVGGQGIELPANIQQIPLLGGVATKLAALVGLNIWPKNWQGFSTIFGFFLYALLVLPTVMLGRSVRAAHAGGYTNRPALLTLGGVAVVSLVGALLFQFPLMALLPPLSALAVYLMRERLQPGRWSSEELFALLLIAVGAAITFGTEIFFLQDVFHSRLNTLFKFYYQVWVLWGATAGFAAWWLLAWAFGRRAAPLGAKLLVGAWALGFTALFGLAMVYPALAPAQREAGVIWLPGIQMAGAENHKLHGLDGIAALGAGAPGDLAAIRWLRANARATDGIAEAAFTYEYNSQGLHGRVASYTGMPGIIVWRGHEVQWRGGQPSILAEFDARVADQTALYTTTDPQRAAAILRKYGIHYVFVGSIEKGALGLPNPPLPNWPPSAQALGKFAGFMDRVFSQDGTEVYRLRDAVAGTGVAPAVLPARP